MISQKSQSNQAAIYYVEVHRSKIQTHQFFLQTNFKFNLLNKICIICQNKHIIDVTQNCFKLAINE